MNHCADLREACRFTTETEEVHILFSGGLPAQYRKCAAALPPETVMFIAVHPRAQLKLRDLNVDKRKLDQFNASDPPRHEFKGYRSDDGLLVSVYRGRVGQIFYLPTRADSARCHSYYSQSESFAQVVLVHVPLISRLEAPETIKAGERLLVIAYSDVNETLGYEWQVKPGRIVAGQYTKEVSIDTSGLGGQTLVVTAEIGDGLGHATAASARVRILPP